MTDLNNLDRLTDKIYLEGISKVEKESKKMLSEAEIARKRIIAEAREEAEQIISQAKRESERLSRSVEKELQLKGRQMISDLQNEIQNLLSEKIVAQEVKDVFSDKDFIKSAILEAIKNWKNDGNPELILSNELEKELKEAFQTSIGQHVKNLNVTFGGQFTGGFRLGVKDGSYQISFSEQDFVRLLEPYLTNQTRELLFSRS